MTFDPKRHEVFNPSTYQKSVFRTDQKAEFIASSKWFSFLQLTQHYILAEHIEIYKIPTGCVIFHEGDTACYLGCIGEGAVDIIKQDSQGIQKTITVLTSGSVFGEMSLIDGMPRSASAQASDTVTLGVLTRESFFQISQDKSKLAFEITMRISSLISQRLRQTSKKLIDFL